MVTEDKPNIIRFLCLKCRHVVEAVRYEREHITSISSCPKCGSDYIFEEKTALRLDFLVNTLIKMGKIKRWNDV